jgi:hypothetical protein
MLARASTTIGRPAAEIVSLLVAPERKWRLGLDHGSESLAEVGLNLAGLRIYKHVRLQADAPALEISADRAMMPVTWVATGGRAIFPRMEGTLHVEPDGAESTRLSLNATYDPPLGELGRQIDRVVMHRLAERTMLDFVERVAAELDREAEAREHATPGAADPDAATS